MKYKSLEHAQIAADWINQSEDTKAYIMIFKPTVDGDICFNTVKFEHKPETGTYSAIIDGKTYFLDQVEQEYSGDIYVCLYD